MGKHNAPRKVSKEINHAVLRQAMLRRLPRVVAGSGKLFFPAVPALTEHFTEVLHKMFAVLGRVFDKEETKGIRESLRTKLDEAFNRSADSRVMVEYHTNEPPATSLTYTISVDARTVEAQYEHWTQTRTPPLFGSQPDAKIMELARGLGIPVEVPVLDVGAGTGRNTLPLAREGFPTDAVELAPALVEILKTEARKEQLPIKIILGDMVEDRLELAANHYKLVFLSEVIASHIRTVEACRSIFEDVANTLAPGGLLAFNAFMATPQYGPDALARELSQVFWCIAFTQKDMASAMAGLPFELISDESAFEFERDHLPAEHWPPTGWFEQWAHGMDLFDVPQEKSPVELRWLVYRKLG
ncbi:MAG: class I SAM-dependent methyltransferase [Deltaproteobacteria bacterium]|nr:class I SAM-dependent methyltransferase [Deltaproteobacteria bacterium]